MPKAHQPRAENIKNEINNKFEIKFDCHLEPMPLPAGSTADKKIKNFKAQNKIKDPK